MGDEISVGGVAETSASDGRRLVPMKVGSATVYVEQVGPPAEAVADDTIYPVAPSPREAFETAGEVLRECVRVVGEKMAAMGEAAQPHAVALAKAALPEEVTVEFSLTFEASGRAALIPVFVTGESKAQTGLKVTAVWQKPDVG